MNKRNQMIIVIGIVLVLGVSTVLYSQGYFEFLSPEPTISLVEVSKYVENEMKVEWVGDWNNPDRVEYCVGTNISIIVTLVNSGDIDGFANIQLELNGSQIDSYRYFVKEGEEYTKNLSSRTSACNVTNDDIQLILTVEKT